MQRTGYWSSTLANPKMKRAKTHKECLAVVSAILILHSCLYRSRFTIKTDLEEFKCLLTMTETTGNLAGWRPHVLQFDFNVVHRAGMKHQAADALSRLKTAGRNTENVGGGNHSKYGIRPGTNPKWKVRGRFRRGWPQKSIEGTLKAWRYVLAAVALT